MNASDLSYAGTELEELRRELAHYVSKYNAFKSPYRTGFKQMLLDASNGVTEPTPLPAFTGPAYNGYTGLRISEPSSVPSLTYSSTEFDTKDCVLYFDDLNGSTGTWTGDPTFTYQWYRYNGTTKTDIVGATTNQYAPTTSDVGYAIGLKVTATNESGSVTEDIGWDTAFGYPGAESFISNFDANKCYTPEFIPYAVASGTAVAGVNPGEVDVTLVAGTQVASHPDTEYLIYVKKSGSPGIYFTMTSTTDTLTGIPAGTYNVDVFAVKNDVSYCPTSVRIGTGVVVS